MNFEERQQVISKLDQLGCLHESAAYDRVTGMAARTFKVPVCVTVVAHNDKLHWLSWAGKFFDRNLPKQTFGSSLLVNYVMEQPPGQVTVIQDCKRHGLTRSMTELPVPGVPYARFICAIPLYLFGVSVGVLIIADVKPWPDGLSIRQKCFMVDFAKLIMSELRLQYETRVKKASYVAATAHDMKTPLACLTRCLETLLNEAQKLKAAGGIGSGGASRSGSGALSEGVSATERKSGDESDINTIGTGDNKDGEGGGKGGEGEGVSGKEQQEERSAEEEETFNQQAILQAEAEAKAMAVSVEDAVSIAQLNVDIMYNIIGGALGGDVRIGGNASRGGSGQISSHTKATTNKHSEKVTADSKKKNEATDNGDQKTKKQSAEMEEGVGARDMEKTQEDGAAAAVADVNTTIENGEPAVNDDAETEDYRPRGYTSRMNRLAFKGLRRSISEFSPLELTERCVRVFKTSPDTLVPINIHVLQVEGSEGEESGDDDDDDGDGGGNGGGGGSETATKKPPKYPTGRSGEANVPVNVYSDYQILWHCLVDMLSNACKYTKEGSIDVWISARERDSAVFIKILVQDTGPGLPKGMEDVVFAKPFCTARRKEDGAGLGLFSMRRNIKIVGGSGGCSPGEGGKGLLVWVEFPDYGGPVNGQDEGVGGGSGTRGSVGRSVVAEEVHKRQEEDEVEGLKTVMEEVEKEGLDIVVSAREDISKRQAQDVVDVFGNNNNQPNKLAQAAAECSMSLKLDPVSAITTTASQTEQLGRLPPASLELNSRSATVGPARRGGGIRGTEPPAPTTMLNGLRKVALVVDDCRVFVKLISSMLSKRGWSVDIARDGKEGLDMLKAHEYLVVFMDFLMPCLSGVDCTKAYRTWEVTQRALLAGGDEDPDIRASLGGVEGIDIVINDGDDDDDDDDSNPMAKKPRLRTYIVGVSAVSSAEEFVEGMKMGMDRALEKPMTPAKLDDTLISLEEYLHFCLC